MKMYEKPVVEVLDDVAEVVCADGSNEAGGNGTENNNVAKCRFGRSEASAGADDCQSCSATGGLSKDQKHTYKADFISCADNMPLKNNKK